MLKKISIMFIAFLMLATYSLPTYADASNDEQPVHNNTEIGEEQVLDDEDMIVEPMVAPIIIGIAVRGLFQLGRAELARYLQREGASAYCNRYGNSGPKWISDMVCN